MFQRLLSTVGGDLRVTFNDVLSGRLVLQRGFGTVFGDLLAACVQAW